MGGQQGGRRIGGDCRCTGCNRPRRYAENGYWAGALAKRTNAWLVRLPYVCDQLCGSTAHQWSAWHTGGGWAWAGGRMPLAPIALYICGPYALGVDAVGWENATPMVGRGAGGEDTGRLPNSCAPLCGVVQEGIWSSRHGHWIGGRGHHRRLSLQRSIKDVHDVAWSLQRLNSVWRSRIEESKIITDQLWYAAAKGRSKRVEVTPPNPPRRGWGGGSTTVQ